ncbi:MAG TPA: abortive infection family protein [Thermoleophilaceae bacterium]|nr:abortive infection family protein [Thermoleophilaceae bacterium]
MATNSEVNGFRLVACRELLETHPQSVRIREQVEALEDAFPERPGVVVSFCRSIIETTCKTILTDHGSQIDGNWTPVQLVKKSLQVLGVSQEADSGDAALNDSVKTVVRGTFQVIQGITELRNLHGSGAHGADAYAPLLGESYAEILARATDSVVGLLLKTHLQHQSGEPLARFRYKDHPEFNDFIDDNHEPFQVFDVSLVPSEALFQTDFEAYRAALIEAQQAQQAVAAEEQAEQ